MLDDHVSVALPPSVIDALSNEIATVGDDDGSPTASLNTTPLLAEPPSAAVPYKLPSLACTKAACYSLQVGLIRRENSSRRYAPTRLPEFFLLVPRLGFDPEARWFFCCRELGIGPAHAKIFAIQTLPPRIVVNYLCGSSSRYRNAQATGLRASGPRPAASLGLPRPRAKFQASTGISRGARIDKVLISKRSAQVPYNVTL